MNAALMYHDVTASGCLGNNDESGFPGGDAARYKLTTEQFQEHLAAIAARGGRPVLTFDDGGASAMRIAELLDARGWRGHFFIATAFIGRRGFLNRGEIEQLHRLGHIVGSHSHTHPLRMARCTDARLREEWTRSAAILDDIVGASVDVASVPGGYHSARVSAAAAAAGIRFLFTSMPTLRMRCESGVTVLGRYAIQRHTPALRAAALSAGDLVPRAGQTVLWRAKLAARTIGGAWYLRVRERLLGGSPDAGWGDHQDEIKKSGAVAP
ncbi:MAG TPA: polysaccharide deacetylase family protein [Vicinamibacterales bacterium]|nr:polysaccharide deacetylase family protein [Vicinamibacterales bacterium]